MRLPDVSLDRIDMRTRICAVRCRILLALLAVGGVVAVDLCRARGVAAISRAGAAAHRRDRRRAFRRGERAHPGSAPIWRKRCRASSCRRRLASARVRSANLVIGRSALAPDLTTVGWLPEVEPAHAGRGAEIAWRSGVSEPDLSRAGRQADRSCEARPAAFPIVDIAPARNRFVIGVDAGSFPDRLAAIREAKRYA